MSSAAAAASQTTVKPDLTFSAIWAPGGSSYPITAQSWVLVYQKQPNANDVKMLQAWIGYLIGDGQKLLPSIGFRIAARQHRLEGQGAAEPDQLLIVVTTMTHTDQIGSPP